MKKIYFLSLMVILSLTFYFCDKDNCLNGIKIPDGAFAYTGFDSTGVEIVRGWIKFDFDDSTTISGEWELDTIGEPQNIGPQIGSGNIVGSLVNDQLHLNLNPQFVDNNVFLTCPNNDQKLEGQWIYSGFPGVINSGSFVAEKK
jgi:hypothetical protein